MTEHTPLRGFLADMQRFPPLVVTFPFNPGSIRDNKAVTYATEEPALSSGEGPSKRWARGGDRTIGFSFQLHGLERTPNLLDLAPVGGISTELAKLRSFLYPREDSWLAPSVEKGKSASSPPRCLFGFGTRVLECVVTSIEIEETQFNYALAPVRAEVNITLTVVEEPGNPLYELDRNLRNTLALAGLLDVRPF